MATPFPFGSGNTLLASQLNAITTLPVSTKTASHTLTIADVGTRVVMNSASATTITVNTSIFGASDKVEILNIGAGVCTVTAGTCTVGTTGTLALPQNAGGTLTFISASASNFTAQNKVLQVVQSTYSTQTSTTSATYVTTGQSSSITPLSTSSKILVLCSFPAQSAASQNMNVTLFRGTVAGTDLAPGANGFGYWSGGTVVLVGTFSMIYLDSPSTTSATTYTAGMKTTGGTIYAQVGSTIGTMTLMEISA